MSFNLVIPQLPNFLESLGGARYKGLIIGVFALSALGSRPFSGKLIDVIGRKPIVLFGIIVTIVVTFGYNLVYSVPFFLALRFMHGLSAGFTPTGTTAMAADIVPANKRGEAMGIVGMAGNIGMSIGPALGSEIGVTFGNSTMFVSGGFIACLTLIPLFWLKETRESTQRFNLRMLKLSWREILEPAVFLQGVVMLLSVITFGALLTLVPDYCEVFGLKKNGYFFTIVTVSSITMRILSGKLSDKYGREIVLWVGMIFLVAANLMMIYAGSITDLFIAAGLFGLSTGTNSPTLFAWTIDNCKSEQIGRVISTLFIFLEAGIILGSVIPAEIYANKAENLSQAFVFTLVCGLLSLGLVSGALYRARRG